MASLREPVTLDGVLRGEGREAACSVSAIRVTMQGVPGLPPAYAQFRIVSVSSDLPEGTFELLVAGNTIPLRHKSGQWLASA